VVFAEYSWTPGDMVQAEDRAHRIGQRQSVNVQYLHVKTSIDDVMWKTLATKLDNVGQVLVSALWNRLRTCHSQRYDCPHAAHRSRAATLPAVAMPGHAWPVMSSTINRAQVLDGAKDALHVEAAATVEAPLAADQGRLDAFLVSSSPVVGADGVVIGDARKRSATAVTAREPLLPRADMQAGADAVAGRDAKRSRPY